MPDRKASPLHTQLPEEQGGAVLRAVPPGYSTIDDAAIGQDRLTSDIVGILRRKECDQRGHVFWCLGTAEGDPFDIFLVRLALRRSGDLGKAFVDLDPHVSTDDAGAIGIHGDLMRGVFLGRRLGERPHRKFRRRIDP